MMDKSQNAPGIILSSQKEAGSKLAKWSSERVFSASKICAFCGKEFCPWVKMKDGKVLSVMGETLWEKQKCCSIQCAKKFSPTSLNAQARKKISNRLKEIRHSPIKRGGNGQLLPLPQLALLHALGDGWMAEHSIKTNAGHRNGTYPNCYKVDIANPEMMMAIELDGGSHTSLERQEQDQKKVKFLVGLGWSIYRVSNEKSLYLYSTFKSVDTLLTSLME